MLPSRSLSRGPLSLALSAPIQSEREEAFSFRREPFEGFMDCGESHSHRAKAAVLVRRTT
jgi:hypothetical protein